MIDLLDRLHERLRANPLAYRLVIGTRILLCAGFLPTGMVKLLGQPFTVMDTSTPIGLFFHAMHQSGLYWRFLGATQIIASILVLIPRVAHLGGLIFAPIMLNIFVITVSMEFRGTPVETGLMLFASLLLVVWDYHRWRGLLTTRAAHDETPEPLPLSTLERIGYTLGAAAGLTFFLGTRSLVPHSVAMPALLVAGLAVLAVLLLALGRPWRSHNSAAMKRIPLSLLALVLTLSLVPAAFAEQSGFDPELAKKLGADERGMRMYVLCILKTGPKDAEIMGDARKEIFAGHFANIGRLAEEGKLAVAGPFGKNDKSYRGLYIFNVTTIEEAEKLVVLDPAVKAGVFVPDLTLWYGSAAMMVVSDTHKKLEKPKQ